MMSLHKLTAGDGYLYLIRQVAAADSTERGRSTLSDYYSAKGESPGRWVGSGLASLSRHRCPRGFPASRRRDLDGGRGLAGHRSPNDRAVRGGLAPQRRCDHRPI